MLPLLSLPISRFQRLSKLMDFNLGRCPRLLHFAPFGAENKESHSLENLFPIRLRYGFGLAFHPHIIRNVVAVSFHERLEVVSAANDFAAAARPAVADKVVHLLVIKRGVVDGNFFAWFYATPRDQVQALDPGVGIAGMVDGFPVFRVGTPTHKNLIGERVGILGEPPLLFGVPVCAHMLFTYQHMRLLFVSFDQLARVDRLDGIHPIPALAVQQKMPLLMSPALALQTGGNQLFEKLAMAPGLIQQNQIRAARLFQRVSDVAVWIDLQQVKLAVLVHANVAAAVARAVQTEEHLARHVFQLRSQHVIFTLQTGHAFVVAPLEIEVLERLAFWKPKLDRAINVRLEFILSVLHYQHAKLTALDELLDQSRAKLRDHLLSLLA